jgi:hypothetical protein
MDSDLSTERSRIPKLTGTANYLLWSSQVQSYFEAQDIWEDVDPLVEGESTPVLKEDEKPATAIYGQAAPTPVKRKRLTAAESKARAGISKARYILMTTTGPGPLAVIQWIQSPREQWAKLEATYAPTGIEHIATKLDSFYGYVPKSDVVGVEVIGADLDRIQHEIGMLSPMDRPSEGAKLSLLFRIMRARGSRYDAVVTQIKLSRGQSYDSAVGEIANFERHLIAPKPQKETALRAEVAPQASTVALDARPTAGKGSGGAQGSKPRFSGNCFYCDKPGHRKSECQTRKRNQKSEKRAGEASTGPLATPTARKGLSPPPQQAANMAIKEPHDGLVVRAWLAATDIDSATSRASSAVTWILDSGCTRHMTFARDAFTEYHTLDRPIPISIASGGSISAIAEGTVAVETIVDGSRRIVEFKDVLHVPRLAGHLLSVSQLEDDGIEGTIRNRQIRLKREGETVCIGHSINGTYVISGTQYETISAYLATASKQMTAKDAILWHRRFGHLSSQSLERAHIVTDGMPGPMQDFTEPCESCRLNKSTRVINRRAPERAANPLDRVHSDVWGPYRVPALGGGIYFITFTDDYTRKSWVYIASTKDQIRPIFSEFRVHVELETGRKVRIVRCDNGGEYKGLESIFGILYGILFEYTTAYTPWQNGVPERLNRTLVSTARAMLADARLPPELWGEAVITASYIRNRTPIGLGGMTPEEAYSGKKPSVSHLRAWGCVAYAHLAAEQRDGDKLAPNAVRTALVGYMPTSKQYRLYNPETKKIIVSTSPRFEEGHRLEFPGKAAPSTEVVGFDPMEADPLNGPAPDLNSHVQRTETPQSLRKTRTASTTGVTDAPAVHTNDDGADILLPSMLLPTDDEAPSATGVNDGDPAAGIAHRSSPSTRTVSPGGEQTGQERSPSPAPSENTVSQQSASGDSSSGDAADQGAPDPGPAFRRSGRERRPAQRFEGAYAAAIEEIPTPHSFKEAMKSREYAAEWAQAVHEELTMLQSLGAWEIVKLPEGRKTVGCRWVFRVKYTPTGLIDRFKARLVAQGFSQVPGEDFLETFSPTIRAESLRFLLALGAREDLEMRQADVVTAYPNSELHAEVYLRPPDGLDCPEGFVLRARRSIPGLKQSGREWYIEACKGFKELGLQPLFADPSIFTTPDRKLIIGLYVDDMLILSKNSEVINTVIAALRKRWKVKDLGEVRDILGLRVTRDRKRRLLYIDQAGYIDQMVKRFGLADAKPRTTPSTDRVALVKGDGSEPLTDQRLYQEAVGCLNWVTVCTRFDIAYVSTQLSQHCSAPTVRH